MVSSTGLDKYYGIQYPKKSPERGDRADLWASNHEAVSKEGVAAVILARTRRRMRRESLNSTPGREAAQIDMIRLRLTTPQALTSISISFDRATLSSFKFRRLVERLRGPNRLELSGPMMRAEAVASKLLKSTYTLRNLTSHLRATSKSQKTGNGSKKITQSQPRLYLEFGNGSPTTTPGAGSCRKSEMELYQHTVAGWYTWLASNILATDRSHIDSAISTHQRVLKIAKRALGGHIELHGFKGNLGASLFTRFKMTSELGHLGAEGSSVSQGGFSRAARVWRPHPPRCSAK
ncbi:hypothetical protein DFP72DRAFT_851667 [Ephemerocybe angulata]|uniref:Uncharacterized protein n=1 Tax=Ephemerocybe angulata TaxID=980116 RepID=A0A8H6M168_9AGAR|nr:hypothetical protein DFP72DRAFT_851667 [Tulosesus angulatus]